MINKIEKVKNAINAAGADGALIVSKVNLFYLTQRIFDGFIYISAEGETLVFAKKAANAPENCIFVRKYEEMPEIFKNKGLKAPEKLMVEADRLSYLEITRILKVFGSEMLISPVDALRVIKSEDEIEKIKNSCSLHKLTYEKIPYLYEKGMTDKAIQARVEYEMAKNGMQGVNRIKGESMECAGGMVIAGDNALTASPYDFGMGGGGTQSYPMGANGTEIKRGNTVSFDMSGFYNGWWCDITRVFSLGEVSEEAKKVHAVSEKIHEFIMENAVPGANCGELFDKITEIVSEAGYQDIFMNNVQKNSFVGHGIGLELNERPVIARKSRDVLQNGMVFALEPKFAVKGVGPVGNEDSYAIINGKCERLSNVSREIVPFKE